ncbi:MAG: hypothetical protein WCY01_00640 [Alkalispirochaeta sp.]|jgi:hypothetical protein
MSRPSGGVTPFRVATLIGPVLGVLILSGTIAACSFPSSVGQTPDFKVGDLFLSRHPTKSLHYILSVAVFNGSDRELRAFRIDAVASTDEGNDLDDSGAVTTELALSRRCTVLPGAAPILKLEFATPFLFTPPAGITLTDIRFHSFLLSDGTEAIGEIYYPYAVKEN